MTTESITYTSEGLRCAIMNAESNYGAALAKLGWNLDVQARKEAKHWCDFWQNRIKELKALKGKG